MRIFSAKKNRAGNSIHCKNCGVKINTGEKYYFYFKRYSKRSRGAKVVHCASHYPRPSDLTSSKMGEVYDAQQDASRALSGCEDAESMSAILADIISVAESVKEQYEESLENMPEQLRESSDSGQQIQEKIDALDNYIQELEDKQSECDSWQADDPLDGETEEESHERQIEEFRGEVEDSVSSLEV